MKISENQQLLQKIFKFLYNLPDFYDLHKKKLVKSQT